MSVQQTRKATAPVQPGDRIRLTGRFLRDTGQRTGGEGAKRWTVRACDCGLCKGGRYVAVDDPVSGVFFSQEEIAADPRLGWRHLERGNVERLGVRIAANYP